MHKKLLIIPVSIFATAIFAVAPALAADVNTHVVTGFDSNKGVLSGAGEGCVIAGAGESDFSCDGREIPPTPAVKPVAQKPADIKPAAPRAVQIATFESDTLFTTGSYTLRHTREVDATANVIKRLRSYTAVEVVGHADYRGNENSNQILSERRALAVSKRLVRAGIPASKIRANGLGIYEPVVGYDNCLGYKGRLLAKCLAPDRRVTVSVIGGVK